MEGSGARERERKRMRKWRREKGGVRERDRKRDTYIHPRSEEINMKGGRETLIF